ncbi:AAA family ATPase [candidate division KSB1 bacterium]|nr:AAA family ATPase [candidate division KSB1 bacterium]
MPEIELYKYNPSRSSFQELEATLVGREALVQDLLTRLRNQIENKSNQNFLLVGPRGIGKTNLLRILNHRIQQTPELAGAYLPLNFAEEEYSIISLRDFNIKILEVLQMTKPDASITQAFQAYSQEVNDEIAVEKSSDFLKKFAQQNRIKLLIFVDNLDLLFGEQIKFESAQKKFRHVLMNENFLVMIGTAPTFFKEVRGYEKPFYHFFKIYDLDELDQAQMEELLKKRAQFDGNQGLMERLKSYKPKLKALRHLTGGNPRLVLMLYQLLSSANLPEVKMALNSLLDDLTPHYKHKLESIKSPQQRKLLDTLARLNKAATPTELAQATRLPVNQVSSLLKRLQDEGFVVPTKSRRQKNTYYIISERLFRIWHQMRFSAVGQSRLPFLVEFITIWYSLPELREEYSRLEACYETAFKTGNIYEAARLIDHITYLGEAAPRPDLKNEIFDRSIQHYLDLEQWEEAKHFIKDELQRYLIENKPQMATRKYLGWGILHGTKGFKQKDRYLIEQAFQQYAAAVNIRPDRHEAWYNWGNALSQLARQTGEQVFFEAAFEKYAEAVRIKPDRHEVWYNWGNALGELAQQTGERALFDAAFEKYTEVVRIKPDDHDAWNNWGSTLGELARQTGERALFEAAFEKYNEAVRLKPDMHAAWYNWGNALGRLARQTGERTLFEAAFEKYSNAVRIKPDDHEAWYNWGYYLGELTRQTGERALLEATFEKYAEALRIQPDKHEAHIELGLLEIYQHHFEAAIPHFKKAFEIAIVKKLGNTIMLYGNNYVQSLFDTTLIQIQAQNLGQAKTRFTEALNLKTVLDAESWKKKLIDFFNQLTTQNQVSIFRVLYQILSRPEHAVEIELLQPFALACDYWGNGDNPKVMDELNPELREIVEKIIQKSKAKTDAENEASA